VGGGVLKLGSNHDTSDFERGSGLWGTLEGKGNHDSRCGFPKKKDRTNKSGWKAAAWSGTSRAELSFIEKT